MNFTDRNLKLFIKILIVFVNIIIISSCDLQKNADKNENKIRLITLSPHLAELVVSAGAIDNLVGVVSYSDFPQEVKSIQNIGDAFKVDFETILALKPDYVLSWNGGTPMAIIDKLKSLNINVLETNINALYDIPKTIKQIAEITNTFDVAELNIKLFNDTIDELKSQTIEKQSLFIETFHQPIYTVSGSHWISEAAGLCGFENIFSELNQESVSVNIEAIISKNPQAILNISKQADLQWQKWQSVSAVKNDKVYTIDPDFFSRPSMRLLKGIKQLCAYNQITVK